LTADAVWDEAIAGHVAAGSFGEEVQAHSTQASVDIIDGIVDDILTDTGTTIPGLIAALNDPTAAAIADAVWDEAIAGHVTAGTFGLNLDTTISTRATQASVDVIDGIVDDILTDTGTTIPASIAALNDPTAAAIADAVWDEATSGHAIVGSTGEALTDAASGGSAPTAAAIADAVWDEATSGHVTAGTFGLNLDATVSTRATQASVDVIDGIVDDILTDTGTTIPASITALNDPTAAAIADAVWDEAIAGHVAAGSFGEEVQSHALSTEVAALNDLSSADVQSALTAQGYTVARAGNLDNLDAAISTVATQASVDIIDGIVDDILTDTGTTIPGLITGLNDPTAAAIADAVWDEAIAGHVTAGTFGLQLDATISSRATQTSVDSLNDISTADVQTALTSQGYTVARAGNLDNLDATVSSRSDFDNTTDETILNVSEVNEIADAVWDEAVVGHVASGSFGEEVQAHSTQASVDVIDGIVDDILTDTGTTIPGLIAALNDPTAAAIADAVWDEATADHVIAGSTGEAVAAGGATAAAIADAVWDEATAGHVTAGTFGLNLDATVSTRATQASVDVIDGIVDDILTDTGTTIPGAIAALNDPTAAAIADAVWDEATADHVIAGSTGEAIAASGVTAAAIADAVWDEATSGHAIVGSTGEALTDAASGGSAPTAAAIADAVWDEATSGHVAGGSFGANLDAAISATSTQASVDVIDGIVDDILTDTGTTIPGLIAGLNDPTAAAIADAVWDEATSGHITAGTFGLNIDAAISTRATQASLDALNDLSSADVQTALTAQGYTIARAGNLDNLDATISSRSTFDSTTDAVTLGSGSVAAVADAIWDEAASGHNTAGTFGEQLQTARKHLTNRAVITGSGPFTTTIYEDDATTPLKTFTVTADKLERTP